MSFSIQALALEHLVRNSGSMRPEVHTIPKGMDDEVARLALRSMGVTIDTLNQDQLEYLQSWKEGT